MYNIQLGHTESERDTIVNAIQLLDRDRFESVIHNLLDRTRSLPPNQVVVVDNLDIGIGPSSVSS